MSESTISELRPAQGAMLQLCGMLVLRAGVRLADTREQQAKAMREGLGVLRQLLRCDHGADPVAWHNRLLADMPAAYRGGPHWPEVKAAVLTAARDPERLALLQAVVADPRQMSGRLPAG